MIINDKTRIKSTNVHTSISSVVGSATSFYVEWLKTRFPKGFFKDVYIAGMLTSVENQSKDIVKKSKPLLIVKPEYTAENGFIETVPYWHNTLQYTYKDLDKYYRPVIRDNTRSLTIHAIPDRIKISLPTRILVPTKIYGINLLHYIKNIIEPGGHMFINGVTFENEIPNSFINLVFDIVFNSENRDFNNELDKEIRAVEKKIYFREVKIIENLEKIKVLSQGNVSSSESMTIMQLNMEISTFTREIKKLNIEIDKLKVQLKDIRNLSDPDEDVRRKNRDDLEDYLNTFSCGAITCRKNLSTGNFEYAFKNVSNVLVHMDSLPTLDGYRKGRTEDYAVIAFDLVFDFNTNSNFIFECKKGNVNIDEDIMIDSVDSNSYQFNICFNDMVPRFITDDERIFNFRKKQKFVCDFNTDVDILPFGDVLDADSKYVYDKIYKADKSGRHYHDIDVSNYTDLFRLKIFVDNSNGSRKPDGYRGEDSDGNANENISIARDYTEKTNGFETTVSWQKAELVEGIDYKINWNKLQIELIKPLYNATYLLSIYTNDYRLNSIKKEEEDYDKVKLINKDENKFILISPNNTRYELIIDNDGKIRTELFKLDSRLQVTPYQIPSMMNKVLYDLKVEDNGVLVTSPAKIKNPKATTIETDKYYITVSDSGVLISKQKLTNN